MGGSALPRERLQKFLARAGVASRRASEKLIREGLVTVNGAAVSVLGTQVDPERDEVAVQGRPVRLEARRYFLHYKQSGVVTTMQDPKERPSIGEVVDTLGTRVVPVGRLDIDAEGAILLTDDGVLANLLTHPRHQVERIYLVLVQGRPSAAALAKLVAGVRLEDGLAFAKSAHSFAERGDDCWIQVTVTEGRNHLVKRLCAAIGHPVKRLFRPFHGGLSIFGMNPGDSRELRTEEVALSYAHANGQAPSAATPFLPANEGSERQQ